MTDLPLVFVGGLLGSAHCVGMCGPLAALASSNARRLRGAVGRQLLFSAGRIFTYAFCGAVAGFASARLAGGARALVVSQASLAVAAGIALIVVGLATAGVLPRPALRVLGRAPCGAAAALKTILTAPSRTSVFLAGVGTGFIPCGLVYAFLLKAGATGSLVEGATTMAVFGLGTAPLLTVVGSGGALLPVAARARMFRLAAWCVVLAGTITVARGAAQLLPAKAATAPCPWCAEAAE